MRIKGLFLASAAIASLPIGVASAADLPARMPTKAPMLVSHPFSWTGFYVGVNAGAIWVGSSETETDGGPIIITPPASTNYSGFIGGVQAGYNWQFSNFVLGVEGDFDLTSAKKSVAVNVINTRNLQLSALSTIRGRVGLAFDHWLPYFTGGVAFADVKNEIVNSAIPFTVDRSNWTTGWTIGGGLEYAFADHWSAKAEYLYVRFPDQSFSGITPSAYGFTLKDSASIARVGINYRF
jgi:outer membrane immunogenic protein